MEKSILFTNSEAIAILKNMKRKRSLENCIALEMGIKALREQQTDKGRRRAEAEAIRNCYIPHLNRTENDFEQGYNSAIRDVLDILVKERYNNK